MATKHWGRDAYINQAEAGSYDSNQAAANAMVFHFLRNAGFDWLWECDGDVGFSDTDCNHVPDGAMEDSGTASWSAVTSGGPGPTITKDTTTVKSGTQSLKVVSNNVGDGVQSANMLAITRGGSNNAQIGFTAPNMRLTVPAKTFSKTVIGMNLTIIGAVNPGNDGTFPITSKPGATGNQIVFTNGGGVAENNSFNWWTDEPYEVVFWAYNDTAAAWDVEVDKGNGTPVNLGTIAVDGGVWTQYHFTFTLSGAGSVYLQFIDSAQAGEATLYIDGLHVFRSLFEYFPGNQYGTDGILTNPDQFSTGGSYTPGAADVGKWLFMWDATNNTNSGWYKITTDLGGGSVQVDLRSPTAAFVNASSLDYRIVDIEGSCSNLEYDYGWVYAGFGIESPHTSKWRFFLRDFKEDSSRTSRSSQMWAAPEDTDFNVDTGSFFKSGSSVQKSRMGDYEAASPMADKKHVWNGGSLTGANVISRSFLMTDEDLSFFTFHHWSTGGFEGNYFVGYAGGASKRSGAMDFSFLSAFDITGSGASKEVRWDSDSDRFSLDGTGFDENGEAVTSAIGIMGYNNTVESLEISNAGVNPWSGNEWIRKVRFYTDPSGDEGHPVTEDGDCGMFMTRTNIGDLYTWDSDQYLALTAGLVWEWSGESLVP